jgi:hypothetical protein
VSTPASLRVHVEELVVQGLGPLSREALRDAVASALVRRLALDPHLPWDRGQDVAAMDAGAIRVRPGAGAAGVGEAIAAALHRGMTATPPTSSPGRQTPGGGASTP